MAECSPRFRPRQERGSWRRIVPAPAGGGGAPPPHGRWRGPADAGGSAARVAGWGGLAPWPHGSAAKRPLHRGLYSVARFAGCNARLTRRPCSRSFQEAFPRAALGMRRGAKKLRTTSFELRATRGGRTGRACRVARVVRPRRGRSAAGPRALPLVTHHGLRHSISNSLCSSRCGLIFRTSRTFRTSSAAAAAKTRG